MGSQHSDTIAGSFFIKKYTGILLPGGKFIQILYLFKKPFLVHVSIPCYYKCIKRINTLNTRITEKGASYVILGLSGQASHLRTDCRKIPDADPVRSCGAISKMPSVRQLAVELSINPNTIQRAYMELEQQGLICR